MKRRSFLKGLCAAAALAISGLLPELAPKAVALRRVTHWRITVLDPFRDHEDHRAKRVYELADSPNLDLFRACVRAAQDGTMYGGATVRVESVLS